MKYKMFLVALSVLVFCATGVLGEVPGQTEHWFQGQRLNHFDATDLRTFSQRYFVIDTYWDKPHGPIILNICGEYTCTGVMDTRQYPLELAKIFNAKVVSVEHRFFGKTQPFEDLSASGLKYLNTKQALADLAFFIEWYQKTYINIPSDLEVGTLNKWIALGGSYPGAMSAWFRIKYPHLVIGSISSSGVVNAILNFTAFDEQVARAAGPDCTLALQAATLEIEQNLPESKKWFQAESMTDHDFLYLIADSGAEAVQYAHRLELCDQMIRSYRSSKVELKDYSSSVAGVQFTAGRQFANFTTEFFYKVMGNSPDDYNSQIMANPKYNPLGGGRQWWWMKCTEVAFFQVAPEKNSIRSKKIDLAWHRTMCASIFGDDTLSELIWPPPVDDTNMFYGGVNVGASSNIFFTNGIEDPWQWAGVREWNPRRNAQNPDNRSIQAILVDCIQCAHCQDLHTPDKSDPFALRSVRVEQIQAISRWLREN